MSDSGGSIEILDLQNLNKSGYGPIGVYVNLGYEPYPDDYNPLPASAFESYETDKGFIKNTGLRTALFTGKFESSPLRDSGQYDYIYDSKKYSWLYNTFNYMAVKPFRKSQYPRGITQYSAALYAPAPAGSLQIVVNDKNQPQTFAARSSTGSTIKHCFATDPNGNKFILGSVDSNYADNVVAAFKRAVLPRGWRKSVETLDSDLTIYPAYGDGNRRIYNQFRDNITNNYFQISFAKNGIGIAKGIEGFALSGGNSDDRITGTRLSEKMYGARGSDRLIGNGGNDEIWGDDGNDILEPGKGSNQLWGGAGKDIFKIKLGNNTINDFSKEEGDSIDLRPVQRTSHSLSQTSEGVMIKTVQASTLISGAQLSDLIPGQNLFY